MAALVGRQDSTDNSSGNPSPEPEDLISKGFFREAAFKQCHGGFH